MSWVAAVPVAIAIVNDGAHPMFEAYDEGRLTERLLTGATLLGYGGGVAWFGEAQHQTKAKGILGIPESLSARQIVAIGRPASAADSRLPDLSSAPPGPCAARRAGEQGRGARRRETSVSQRQRRCHPRRSAP